MQLSECRVRVCPRALLTIEAGGWCTCESICSLVEQTWWLVSLVCQGARFLSFGGLGWGVVRSRGGGAQVSQRCGCVF